MKFDWDNASYLGGFAHNDKSYDHYINTKNDATYLIGEDGKVVFKVDSNATMYNENGKILGKYRTYQRADGSWLFEDQDGRLLDFQCGYDLLKTERMVMKELLK